MMDWICSHVFLDLIEHNILVVRHSEQELQDNHSLWRIAQVLFEDNKRKLEPSFTLAIDTYSLEELEAFREELEQQFGFGINEDYVLRLKLALLDDIINSYEDAVD